MNKQPVSVLDIVTSFRIQLELFEDAIRTQIALGDANREIQELKAKLGKSDTQTEEEAQN